MIHHDRRSGGGKGGDAEFHYNVTNASGKGCVDHGVAEVVRYQGQNADGGAIA